MNIKYIRAMASLEDWTFQVYSNHLKQVLNALHRHEACIDKYRRKESQCRKRSTIRANYFTRHTEKA